MPLIYEKDNIMKNNYFPSAPQKIKIFDIKLLTVTMTVLFLFFGNFLTAQVAGPNFPSVGANINGIGTYNWVNAGNITVDDTNYASVAINSNNESRYLRGLDYGFAIPATATINGIVVTIAHQSNSSNGGNSIDDYIVRLVKAGNIVGNNKATNTDWPTTMTAQTYGNATDLWGQTWTPAQINANNFGVVLSAQAENSNRTAYVDYITVTVYYTNPNPTISNFNPSSVCDNSTTPITITGTNFTGVTNVRINGVDVTYVVNNPTQITATYPAGGTAGAITVVTATGTATSASNLVVNSIPAVGAITGNSTVCQYFTTTLSNATTGGVWSSDTPSVATINSGTGLVSAITGGTALISYTVTNGACVNTATTTITVTAAPIVSGTGPVCIGGTIQLSPTTGGTWSSSDNTLATIDNTGLVTGHLQGTVNFTFTDNISLCTNTILGVAVYALPSITSQSNPISICSGNNAALTVAASGVGLSYQWYQGANLLTNSGNISGASTNTLTFTSVTLANAATDYYCTVSGSCSPPVSSVPVALAVTQAVAITSQPAVSQTLCSGNTATFSVGATGDGLTYQWYNSSGILTDGGTISGATLPTLTLSNISMSDASTYYCMVSGLSPCSPVNSNNSILIINAGPAITMESTPTQSICAGDSVSLSITATGGNLIYQWYKGATMLADSGNISGVATPTLTINPALPTDSASDYHCMVSNGCVVPVISVDSEIIVNEKPFIASYTTSTCSETAFVIVPTTGTPTAATIVPAGTTYSWLAPIVTGGLTGGSADSGQLGVSQTLYNPTDVVQTATYTVTPTSGTSGNCVGAPFTVVVTVNPRPFIMNIAQSVCSANNIIITPTNGGGNIIPLGTTYTWGVPTVSGGMTGGSGGINQTSFNITLTNTTNTLQTATYNVTATSGTCVGSVFTIAINVNPKPTVAGDILTQTICSGDPIAPITMSNPNGISGTIDYSWTRDNIANVTGMGATGSGSPIIGTLNNSTGTPQTTTFTLYATSDESCVSVPITVSVTVTPIPTVAAAPATQTLCSGSPIATINFSNPNGISGTTYTWTRDNTTNLTGILASGSGNSITGILINNTSVQQTTTFTVTAVSSGCGTNTTTVTVTVSPRPTVAATPMTQTLCGGLPIATITITNPNAVAGTTFTWSRNNTSNLTGIAGSGIGTTINGNLTNISNTDQTTTFTITANVGSCPSAPTATVDVTVKPAPLVLATPAAQGVCTGSTANITFSTSNALAGTTYSWTRDNVANIGGLLGSGTGDISATVTNATASNQLTTFTIVATAPNGCSKTITATLTVYKAMTTPGIEDSQVVCAGSRPTTFFITTPVTGGSGTYIYQWQSSTVGNTGPWTNVGTNLPTYQPPTTNGATPNTWYQVLITSCGATVTSNPVLVTVANNSNFSFSIDFGTGTFCSGANFNPRIFSAHGGGAYIRYSWIADPAYITPTTGGPIGSTSQPWWLFGLSLSEATLPLVLTNNTNANVNTTISITPNIYDADTNAFICSLSPQTTTVTIRPRPTATATLPNPIICSGTSAGVTVTSNLTPSSAIIYNWTRSVNANVTSSLGTGSSGTIAIGNSYIIPDVLTNTSTVNQMVTYTITPTPSPTGCAGTPTTITVTVSPQLLPGTVLANQTICNGADPVAFTQSVAAIGGGLLTYQWQMSTTSAAGPWADISGEIGTTYDSGPITVTTWFRRVVTSTVNGITCSIGNTTPIQVSVNNLNPGAITGTQTICSGGDPSPFGNATPGTGSGAISYQWQSNTTGCGGTFSNIGGATSATLDVTAGLLVTTYYRRATISKLNTVDCTDYSNCITVFVNNVTGGTVGSDETLCGTNPSAFTIVTPATGSGALTYQWQSNTTSCGAGSPWANIGSATLPAYDAPAGLLMTTYYRRVTTSTLNGVSCTANSNCITVTPNSVVAGAIGANRTVCVGGDPAPFTELAPASGVGLNYVWQFSTVSATGPWTDIASTNSPIYDAPGPINVITYFRRLAIATVNSTTCNAPSNFVTVFVNDVTPSVVAGNQNFCGTLNPNAFTVTTPATGNGTLSYQWQSSTVGCGSGWSNILGEINATYDAPSISQTTYYHVVITSTLNSQQCVATSNCITVTSNSKIWTGSMSTDWNNAGNWNPNGVPTAAHCVVVPNTVVKPYVLDPVNDAYCYSLTILSGGILEVIPTKSITVTDQVNVNAGGVFRIKNNANLIQINNVANVGTIDMERTTQPMYRYDYTYWGSPLTLASNYTLGNLSPTTQPDKYYSWNPTNAGGSGNWIQNSAATVMNPNRGYIVRAPQTYSMNPSITQPYTANFIGVPNNGDIQIPIVIGSQPAGLFEDKLNLIGNPYPSGVSADLFLSYATNVPLIDGTIYFWTHHSPPSASYANPFYGNYTYNYTAGDYATYTLFGVTGTAPTGYGGPIPNGFIAAGQGFFVKGKATGTAIFTNAMRDKNNTAFLRTSEQNDKQRVWLNFANAQGGFSQTLVGYTAAATLEYDRGLDATAFSGNFVSFYSVQPDEQTLTIQARPAPFADNDLVDLGYHATVVDNYTIGIDHLDTNFDQQPIYLEDKLLNIIHDLKASPYTFASEIGIFNSRFVLRYTNSFLGVQNPNTTIGLVALIFNKKMRVQASESIASIAVYDISGKHIKTYSLENAVKKFESDFVFAEGIYIAKITLQSGAVETRKLINSK